LGRKSAVNIAVAVNVEAFVWSMHSAAQIFVQTELGESGEAKRFSCDLEARVWFLDYSQKYM
jgi:hypothetical protein